MSYLSHPDLVRIIPELDIKTELGDHPFEERQVKVCSIDLRCDRVFWEAKRGFRTPLDLTSPVVMQVSPRRYWRRRSLDVHEAIKLSPGEMILGRTYERFHIPPKFAGKITGRSSY